MIGSKPISRVQPCCSAPAAPKWPRRNPPAHTAPPIGAAEHRARLNRAALNIRCRYQEVAAASCAGSAADRCLGARGFGPRLLHIQTYLIPLFLSCIPNAAAQWSTQLWVTSTCPSNRPDRVVVHRGDVRDEDLPLHLDVLRLVGKIPAAGLGGEGLKVHSVQSSIKSVRYLWVEGSLTSCPKLRLLWLVKVQVGLSADMGHVVGWSGSRDGF
jgi:hypothetical protein